VGAVSGLDVSPSRSSSGGYRLLSAHVAFELTCIQFGGYKRRCINGHVLGKIFLGGVDGERGGCLRVERHFRVLVEAPAEHLVFVFVSMRTGRIRYKLKTTKNLMKFLAKERFPCRFCSRFRCLPCRPYCGAGGYQASFRLHRCRGRNSSQ